MFENMHPAIIDEETFNAVQEKMSEKKKYHPLLPYLRCADCGSKMYERHEGKDGTVVKFLCAGYTKAPPGTICRSPHIVKEEAVKEAIQNSLCESERTPKEITPEVLDDLVDRIEVHEREEKHKPGSPMKVDVYLK